MNTVYHPVSWAINWPRGAKPFASQEIAVAHGHSLEDLTSSPFNGNPADVETELPVLSKDEETFVAENPGAVVDAVVPPEPVVAPVVPQAPASETPAPAKKPFKKK